MDLGEYISLNAIVAMGVLMWACLVWAFPNVASLKFSLLYVLLISPLFIYRYYRDWAKWQDEFNAFWEETSFPTARQA